jgi:hypothetical protein
VIDATFLNYGGTEKPPGKAGFAGVYIRNDPYVQQLHNASGPFDT